MSEMSDWYILSKINLLYLSIYSNLLFFFIYYNLLEWNYISIIVIYEKLE